ncbi:MAG: hypothetical protein VX460_09025, partial [Planctomycetota bacterium]|nr:hypothetical protein [Planctomycetota bacterium]
MGTDAADLGSGVPIWRVTGLRQELDEPDEAVFARARRRVGAPDGAAARFAKRSLDARGRGADLHLVCQVDVAFELAR